MTTDVNPPKPFYVKFLNAQKKLKPIVKDKTNPHFKSAYASLTQVINAIRESFLEEGIYFSQHWTTSGEDGCLVLRTDIYDDNGVQKSYETRMPYQKSGPQDLGSIVSYCRRYTLKTLFGIADEDDDDDANAAQELHARRTQKKEEPKKKDANIIFDPTNERHVGYLKKCFNHEQCPESLQKTSVGQEALISFKGLVIEDVHKGVKRLRQDYKDIYGHDWSEKDVTTTEG